MLALLALTLGGCRCAPPPPTARCGDMSQTCRELVVGFLDDPAEAPRVARSLAAACDGGEDAACAALGEFYRAGHGVARNPVRAAELFERACAGTGAADGCLALGELYRVGDTVALDERRAQQLFERACDAGSGRACWELAQLYRDGRRFPADMPRVPILIEKACRLGYTAACGPP
jgi:TPR repeat protein